MSFPSLKDQQPPLLNMLELSAVQSSTHFSLTQPFLVYFNRDLSINLLSFMLVRCDDSWVIGFGAVKGKI